MRTAYKQALEDPELQAKAAKLERPVDRPMAMVLGAVKVALNQPPETIALLKATLEAAEGALRRPPEAPWPSGTAAPRSRSRPDDGDMFRGAISGSRTEITIAGQKKRAEASRSA